MNTKLKTAERLEKSAAFRAAFPHTVPVLMGFLVLGIAYGWLMQTKGYHVGWALLASACCFAGSMQFVTVTFLTSAFDPLSAFVMSLMVNARHIFYGISMLDKFKGLGRIRFFLIFWLCDESYSIESGTEPPEGVSRKYFYFFISLLDYSYWLTGTALGGVIGGMVPINTQGLDFALTALFVVMLMEQWKHRERRLLCLGAGAATALMLALFGPDRFVIPAMGLILVLLLGFRPRIEKAWPEEGSS